MKREDVQRIVAGAAEKARTEGLLLIGFKAWAAPDPEGFRLSARDRFDEAMTRAVWDQDERGRARIALTAMERRSAREALDALVEMLDNNQLAALPAGPSD